MYSSIMWPSFEAGEVQRCLGNFQSPFSLSLTVEDFEVSLAAPCCPVINDSDT